MKTKFLKLILAVVVISAMVFPEGVLALPPTPTSFPRPVFWRPFPREGVQNGLPAEATLTLRYFEQEIDPFKDVSFTVFFTSGMVTITVPGFFSGQRSYRDEDSGWFIYEYSFKARMFYPTPGVWNYIPRLSAPPQLPPGVMSGESATEIGAGLPWMRGGRVDVSPSTNPGSMRAGEAGQGDFPFGLYVGGRPVFGCYLEAWSLPVADRVRQELFVRQAKEELCSPGSVVVIKVTMSATLGIEPGLEYVLNPFTSDFEHYNLALFEGLDRLLEISARYGVYIHVNFSLDPYSLVDFTHQWSPDNRYLFGLTDEILAHAAAYKNVLWEVGNELDARFEYQRAWINAWASHVASADAFGRLTTINAKSGNCYATRAYASSLAEVSEDHVCNKGGVAYQKALDARTHNKPVLLTEFSMVRNSPPWTVFDKVVETVDGTMGGSPLQFWGEWWDLDGLKLFRDVAERWGVVGEIVSPRTKADVGIDILYNMGLFWQRTYVPNLYPHGSAAPGEGNGNIVSNNTNATARLLAKSLTSGTVAGGRFVVFLRRGVGQAITGTFTLSTNSPVVQTYFVRGYDPKSGQWIDLGRMNPDASGRVTVEIPTGVSEYYLIYLVG